MLQMRARQPTTPITQTNVCFSASPRTAGNTGPAPIPAVEGEQDPSAHPDTESSLSHWKDMEAEPTDKDTAQHPGKKEYIQQGLTQGVTG